MELKKMIFLFLVVILNPPIICLNKSYLTLPLIKKNDSYLLSVNNITEIIQFIYSDPNIAELNIGSPPQKINILIRPDLSNFYLTSNNHNSSNYDILFNITRKQYQNINYFNNENSQSIQYKESFSRTNYYNNMKEYKIINDYYEIDSDLEKIKLDIILASSIEYEESGILGLQALVENSFNQFIPSFLYQLKFNKLINNYKWFIYYGEKDKQDYLVIGCSPHEFIIPETGNPIFSNLDLANDYYKINDKVFVNNSRIQIKFEQIYIASNLTSLEKEEFYEEKYSDAFLEINLGIIIGTTEYQKYFSNIYLKNYLKNNRCHNGTFNQRIYYIPQKYNYYYCDDSLYNEMKKNFKQIIFKKVDFNEYFSLNFDDLFLRKNGYLIFLIIFKDSSYFWYLGSPFLRKYQFGFDFMNKQIEYYKVRKENNPNTNNSESEGKNNQTKNNLRLLFKLTFIIIFSGLLILLGFIIGKKVYQIRKKRANELNDDYEYEENINP